MKSTRDYCKANNAKYCNGDTPRDHNIPLFSLDNPEQSLRTSPTWDQFQAFSWFKNIFGEIHIPHGNFGVVVVGRGGGGPSLPHYSLLMLLISQWTKGLGVIRTTGGRGRWDNHVQFAHMKIFPKLTPFIPSQFRRETLTRQIIL